MGVAGVGDTGWSLILALAERERLLALIWQRSGSLIQDAAPAEVSSTWRRRAIAHALRVEREIHVLSDLLSRMVSRGLHPIVLKGAPLSQRLYGDFTVRWTTDADVYLPIDERSTAAELLRASGWRNGGGEPPAEETFELVDDEGPLRLEVHSSALDDPLLAHVSLPLEHTIVDVAGRAIAAHSGVYVPAYLAAHLAKHVTPPLLWLIDFHTMWCLLDADARGQALSAARSLGLNKHLNWAQDLATLVSSAAQETAEGARAAWLLQRHLRAGGESGRLLRLARLSTSPITALQVVAGRVWPPSWRGDVGTVPGYLIRRAAHWAYRRIVLETPSTVQDRPLQNGVVRLEQRGSASELAELLKRAKIAWVEPRDVSMEPAIPSFARVRVVADFDEPLRVGDVVAACTTSDHCVLRRVSSINQDGALGLKADAELRREMRVPIEDVLGRCDIVDVDNRHTGIEARPFGSLGALRAIGRRLVRRRRRVR